LATMKNSQMNDNGRRNPDVSDEDLEDIVVKVGPDGETKRIRFREGSSQKQERLRSPGSSSSFPPRTPEHAIVFWRLMRTAIQP